MGKVDLVGEGGVGVGVSGKSAGVNFEEAARGSVKRVNLKNEIITERKITGESVDPVDPWIQVIRGSLFVT